MTTTEKLHMIREINRRNDERWSITTDTRPGGYEGIDLMPEA